MLLIYDRTAHIVVVLLIYYRTAHLCCAVDIWWNSTHLCCGAVDIWWNSTHSVVVLLIHNGTAHILLLFHNEYTSVHHYLWQETTGYHSGLSAEKENANRKRNTQHYSALLTHNRTSTFLLLFWWAYIIGTHICHTRLSIFMPIFTPARLDMWFLFPFSLSNVFIFVINWVLWWSKLAVAVAKSLCIL